MKASKTLALAAGAGDIAAVRTTLKQTPELALDWQPLMDAAFFGHVEVVRLLLDHGADPNILSKSSHKYRPLHRVVELKKTVPRGPRHLQTAELLLARGADPMLRGTCWNVNALALAAMGEPQFLPLMAAHAPRQLDVFTSAALGDWKRVQALLKKQPSLATAKDSNGWTALDYCAATRIGGMDPKWAAGLQTIAAALLDLGADPSASLDRACWTNNEPLVKLLLERGGRLQNGDTLNHAACDGSFGILELLLAHGADLRDRRGTEHHGGLLPFGCTLTMRSLEGARWFLDHGADPNDPGGDDEETGLHIAIRHGAGAPLLRLLVERGARPAAKDRQGRTALALAREKKHAKAIQFLESLSS